MLHIIYLLSIFFISAASVMGQTIEINEPAVFPSLISTIKFNKPLDFCGEEVPLDDQEMKERLEKEMLLTIWDRPQVILWIKRSGRYMPYVEKMLKKNNMPDDLKYVAFVESALLPHVGSSKGAVGIWQFIRPTGSRYGLRIDGQIDERRSIFASTEAAIKYFKKLYGDFNSWTLAAAAYNMGEQGLGRRISEQKTRDYYHLYLPLETQRYIFKILSAKLILSDLKKYGFNMTKDDLYPPMSFDEVKVNLPSSTPIQIIAEAAGTYFKTIKDMNPEIRGDYLYDGNYKILIPKGASGKFYSRLNSLKGTYKAKKPSKKNKKHIVYVVRKGDFLSAIAAKFKVNLSDLLRWNKLRKKSSIHPGQRLIIKR